MRKALLLIMAFICLCLMNPVKGQADSTGSIKVFSAVGTQDTGTISVGGQRLVETKSQNVSELGPLTSMGVMYKTSVAGSVLLSLEQSYAASAVEKTVSADSGFILTHNISVNINDANWHIATIDSVSMPWIRFRIEGLGGNTVSNSIQIKFVK